MITPIIVVGLTIFVATLIQSAIGIGSAMLASAVFAFLLPPTLSAALIGYVAVAIGTVYSIRMREYIDLRISWPPMLGMMISRVLGVVSLMHMEAETVNSILGLILLIFSLYFWLFSGKVRIRATPWKGFALGLCAGYLGGIYSLTGPFAAVYFYSVLTDNKKYAACMNFAFLPSAVLGMGVHLYYGNFTGVLVPLCVTSTVGVLTGVLIGVRMLDKLNYELLAKAIYLFMAIMGVIILLT